jgi:hypothetical protein
MGNYVIRVGNYVTAKAPSLGNFVIVDTWRPSQPLVRVTSIRGTKTIHRPRGSLCRGTESRGIRLPFAR